ncbi:hypothetical protein CsSME_00010202 [Camellia sinensis var. sinensis]
MDRVVSAISSSAFLCLFLVFSWLFQASGNAEGLILIMFYKIGIQHLSIPALGLT